MAASNEALRKILPYILGGAGAAAAAVGTPTDAEAVNIGPRGFRNLMGRDLTETTPGAFRGADNMLRYEIPDNKMSMTPDFRREWLNSDSAFPHNDWMDNAISHPDLFKAYPELRDFDVSAWRTPQGRKGAAYSDGVEASAPDLKSLMDVIAHENQHAVQGLEGFSTGTTPEMVGGYRQYLDNPGEREARMTEARRRLTPEQRAASPQRPNDGMDAWNALLAGGAVTADKPLEQPLFDPVDNIIAALTGPAGIAGKVIAGAVETPLSYALDKIIEGAGKGYEWAAKRSPQMTGAWY